MYKRQNFLRVQLESGDILSPPARVKQVLIVATDVGRAHRDFPAGRRRVYAVQYCNSTL